MPAASSGAPAPMRPASRVRRSAAIGAHLLGAGLGSRVVGVRAVKADAVGLSVFPNLRADDVPPLAEMKHTVLELGGPALGRDPNAVSHGSSLNPYRHECRLPDPPVSS